MILGISLFSTVGIAMGAARHPPLGDQGASHLSQSSLKVPKIAVPQLFSDVLIDVDDFEGWKVRGTGLGELSVFDTARRSK